MTWTAYTNPPEVIPNDDVHEHDTGTLCWCRPTFEDGVIVHHSADERELSEPDYRHRGRN